MELILKEKGRRLFLLSLSPSHDACDPVQQRVLIEDTCLEEQELLRYQWPGCQAACWFDAQRRLSIATLIHEDETMARTASLLHPTTTISEMANETLEIQGTHR